jgi:hypothetical protein
MRPLALEYRAMGLLCCCHLRSKSPLKISYDIFTSLLKMGFEACFTHEVGPKWENRSKSASDSPGALDITVFWPVIKPI